MNIFERGEGMSYEDNGEGGIGIDLGRRNIYCKIFIMEVSWV